MISSQKIPAAVALSLLLLSACTSAPDFVLVADKDQIGSGATVTIEGTTGTLTAPSIGQNGPREVGVTNFTLSKGDGFGGGMASFVLSDTKVRIDFISLSGMFICKNCIQNNLPLNWHLQQPK